MKKKTLTFLLTWLLTKVACLERKQKKQAYTSRNIIKRSLSDYLGIRYTTKTIRGIKSATCIVCLRLVGVCVTILLSH
jgi:Na+(H+)/acetate symporter ActP